jgi:formate/nitrite transporter FocA (FNT family)
MVTTKDINPPVPVSTELLPRIHSNVALSAFILACFFPPLGFILGWVSIVSDHNDGRKESGLATAAMVLGVLFTIAIIWVIIANTKSAPAPCDLTNPNYPAC